MVSIYENFDALKFEKQERIRTAALREFGRYGYKKTSAEQIAQSAGIAKGMIFHYFGSKRGLFEYLTDYACKAIEGWFGGWQQQLAGLDYIEQYRKITKVKLKAYLQQPHIFEFLSILYVHREDTQISEKAKVDCERMMRMRSEAMHFIQTSQNAQFFRKDIDSEKAKRYVAWLLEGYSQQLLAELAGKPLADFATEGYWREFDEILDDMKKLFYRQE